MRQEQIPIFFENNTNEQFYFLETNTNLIKRGQILYDDYIKGDGMDPIGTTPDDLKLNSLGAFYTIPGIITGIFIKI